MVAVEAAAPWAAERAMMLEVEDAGYSVCGPWGDPGSVHSSPKYRQRASPPASRGYTRGGAPSGTHPLATQRYGRREHHAIINEVVEIDI